MRTTSGIRQKVVELLIVYISRLPGRQRPKRIPAFTVIHNSTRWSDLGLELRDRHQFGEFLTDRGMCLQLDTTITSHWTTVGKVVTSVIRHPSPIKDIGPTPSS